MSILFSSYPLMQPMLQLLFLLTLFRRLQWDLLHPLPKHLIQKHHLRPVRFLRLSGDELSIVYILNQLYIVPNILYSIYWNQLLVQYLAVPLRLHLLPLLRRHQLLLELQRRFDLHELQDYFYSSLCH